MKIFVSRSYWLTVRSFSLVHFTRLLGSGLVGIPCQTESSMDKLLERNCYLMVSLLAVRSLVRCLSARNLSSYVSRLLCSVIVFYSVISLFQSSLLSSSSAFIVLVPARSRWLVVCSRLSPGGLLYRAMFERLAFAPGRAGPRIFRGPAQNPRPAPHHGAGRGLFACPPAHSQFRGPAFYGALPGAPFVIHRLFSDRSFFSTVLVRKSGPLVFDRVLSAFVKPYGTPGDRFLSLKP